MTTTTQLLLEHHAEAQAAAAAKLNTSLNLIDVMHAPVTDRTNTPPGSPVEGSAYIVTATATGAWAGHEDDLAFYLTGWVFRTPNEGWTKRIADENLSVMWDGAAWVSLQAAAPVAYTDSTTGTPGTTLGATADADTNDNFASLHARINALEALFQATPMMAS